MSTKAGLAWHQEEPNKLIIRSNDGPDRVFYHGDALRDIRLLTNNSGAISDTYDFSAYGELIGSTGTSPQTMLYNSEQFDPAVDGYYLRQRYYSPAMARFLGRDSFMGDTRSPMSLNPYLYANADPVSFCDPSGNFTLIEFSISNAIRSGLRAMNYGAKAQKVCKLKTTLRLFEAAMVLKSISGYVGASAEFNPWELGQVPWGAAVAQKVTLWKYPGDEDDWPDNMLVEVNYEQKYKSSNEFEMELSGKMTTRGGRLETGKVALIKNLDTLEYSLAVGYEWERKIAEITYCGIVPIGSASVGAEVGVQAGFGGGGSSSAKGYIKIEVLSVANWKFIVFSF